MKKIRCIKAENVKSKNGRRVRCLGDRECLGNNMFIRPIEKARSFLIGLLIFYFRNWSDTSGSNR
ncbi:protein of unknown function [Vibrio tapetis subsp. tapetis]|uniref:Uncharacterized protein n=1 Tax=Vibrio tapetis subsp. tapetis TaxID=1671868 RepID=A0A2N8Z8X1_9VIBR|nr:protein of unknown function [Vibrio tapetis subsp. tapetis]